MTKPRIVDRAAQPYLFIVRRTPMSGLADLPAVHRRVFARLAELGVAPAGPPFWKYNAIDMPAELEVEVGVPTATSLAGDGEIESGVLPAGRYATIGHTGHPDELMVVTGRLLDWAAAEGHRFDVTDDRWAARLEIYETDPAEQPDLSRWQHTLAFRLA